MKPARLKHVAAALAALSFASAAFAQYVWLDDRGVKQYSDMPPPASVPQKRILKQPGGAPAPASESAQNAPSAEKAPMTLAERNAEFQKRRAEQAEKEKKAEEQQRAAADKARNCERAGEYRRMLESGERIAHRDGNGERSFLTDEQRAQELNETRTIMRDCK